MRTALDAPSDTLDEGEQAFVDRIREHGWFRTGVLAADGRPGFSFTTGFWVNAARPEFIIFSMKDAIAHDVFWDVYRREPRQMPRVGVRTDALFETLDAYLFPVARRHYAEHLGWSRWFYAGEEFPCLQIVWPDRENVFPWEEGFDPKLRGLQSDLTERGWTATLAD